MALRLCLLLCLTHSGLAASLYDRAQGHGDWIQNVRRTLHQHPETGFEEFETSKMLRDWLTELKVDFKCVLLLMCHKQANACAVNRECRRLHAGMHLAAQSSKPPASDLL